MLVGQFNRRGTARRAPTNSQGGRNDERGLYPLAKTTNDQQLKDIEDRTQRKQILQNTMSLVDGVNLSGKKVLLFDDLYRSGMTLEVATDLLYKDSGVDTVSMLTLTKTRSNR